MALDLFLTDEAVEELDSAKLFEIRFPASFIGRDPNETSVPPRLTSRDAFLVFPSSARNLAI